MEDVGWPRPGNRCYRVHQAFIVDRRDLAAGCQKLGCERLRLFRHLSVGKHNHHALADRGRRVRHAAHDRRVRAEHIFKGFDRRAGGDAQKRRGTVAQSRISSGHLADHLRLYRQHDQRRLAALWQGIRPRRRRAAETCRPFAQTVVRLDDKGLLRLQLACFEPTGQHGETHISGADENEFYGHGVLLWRVS